MPIKSVDASIVKQWLADNEAIIVDVREPAEHAARKIEGSVLLPLRDVCKAALPECKGKKLVLHCQAGKRGTTACQKLLQEDPSLELYHLEGGIAAWEETGNNVACSGKFFLPLDRQVQLAVGIAVLTGSLFAYFIHPLFTLLTGFFGLGLTFAGLTGFCGLARLLATMPWNR